MNTGITQPVLFLGHGSPMNAIEDNDFSRSWHTLGARLPRPRAILCISAHWETPGVRVTGSAQPPTIHDFGGFPQPLFDVRYRAPGDPALAQRIVALLAPESVAVDPQRGLDHGAWGVLYPMYPQADVPIVQLSLDRNKAPAEHYRLARALAPLREEGVLIVASGNIVHNLAQFRFHSQQPLDWAVRFRDRVNGLIAARAHAELCDFVALGHDGALAINSAEHYLPLLYALALQRDTDRVAIFDDQVLSAISMTSLLIGDPATVAPSSRPVQSASV